MISVVVPTYNVENLIEKCLESIINQDYKNYELLIIDDGSTDNTVEVIKDYLKDKDVNYILHEKENGGQSSSRNAGIRLSKGEYLVFIDSDDVVSKDFLSSLYSAIKEDDDFSFGNYRFVKEQIPLQDNNDKVTEYTRDTLITDFLKRTVNFLVVSMLFKRQFLIDNNLFFDETIRFSEDQMFMWKVIFASKKATYIHKAIYGYYLREASIMTSSPFKKMMNAHDVYRNFTEDMKDKYPEDKKEIEMILPRWQLGTLYTAAKLLDEEEFKKMYKVMDGRSILKRILSIKEMKAYMLGTVSAISWRMLYELCKKM